MVSRLKMGEMEEVDIDHITTDKPSHKVKQQVKGTKQESLLFRCRVLM